MGSRLALALAPFDLTGQREMQALHEANPSPRTGSAVEHHSLWLFPFRDLAKVLFQSSANYFTQCESQEINFFNIIRVEIVPFRSTYANFPAQERTRIPFVKNSSCARSPPHANFNKLALKRARPYADSCPSKTRPGSTELASSAFVLPGN